MSELESMFEDQNPEHTSSAEDELEQATEAELVEQFVMWVEAFTHDLESVPDDYTDQHWCREWWQHPEAVARLKALHEAYTAAVEEQTMSAWWIQHWDPQARVLFSMEGPFKNCQKEHEFLLRSKTYAPRLDTASPPANWLP